MLVLDFIAKIFKLVVYYLDFVIVDDNYSEVRNTISGKVSHYCDLKITVVFVQEDLGLHIMDIGIFINVREKKLPGILLIHLDCDLMAFSNSFSIPQVSAIYYVIFGR